MKKTIIVLMIFSILSVNFLLPNASAATNLSHKQMSDIYGQGYSNALLETVVEVNAKASTRLEENRNLLTKYYDDTKSYVNQRIQDYGNVKNFGDLLIEQASGAMTLADGVLDLLSKLFEGQGGDGSTVPISCKMSTQVSDSTVWSASLPVGVYETCKLQIVFKDGVRHLERGHTLVVEHYPHRSAFTLNMNGIMEYASSTTYIPSSPPASIGAFDAILRNAFGGKAWIEYDGLPFQQEKIEPKFFKSAFSNYRDRPTSRQPVYIPQLQPKLSCPDGDKVVQIDGRGGFVHANGVPVNSDGCTVYWQKPSVTVDDGGKVLLTDPNTGETIDTGVKPPKDKIPVEDKGEGCDGVLCFLGAVTSGIADLIGTIMGLVGDLLEGLLRLFVPESLDFVQEKFDETKAKFEQKFAILNTLMDVFGGLSTHESENILMNYTFSLPITGDKEYKLFEFEAINNFIPYMKRFVSGILIMYTLLFVYRKIVGNGGVMEK